jgi:hypothetical protein
VPPPCRSLLSHRVLRSWYHPRPWALPRLVQATARAERAPPAVRGADAPAGEGEDGAVWPKTKELDAYHQVLYQIVHYYAPAKDAAKVREASLQLAERCGALTAAPLPQWAKEKEATLRAGFQALCQETEAFKEAARGGDFAATEHALEKAHDQYQAVEKLFE